MKFEKPECIAMMQYGCDPSKFALPKKDGVQCCVMKLGEKTIEATKSMFLVNFPPFFYDFINTKFACIGS